MELNILTTVFVLTFLTNSTISQNCIERSKAKELPKGLSSIPVVLVLSTLGSDVRLPCNYCNKRPGISGRIWRRKSLHGKENPVKLDMHDDPAKNRVFVVEDHSLIIRQVTEQDGAYYFCYDAEDEHAKMDILLDVEHRTELDPLELNMPAVLNKEVLKWLKTCKGIKTIPSLSKYECYAEWGSWSKCDVCGKIGERKRVGVCRLQKLEKVEIQAPKGNLVQADFPIVGVGCHSVLLDALPAAKEILQKIPNIVLIEKCEVSCTGFVTKASRLKAFQKGGFLKRIKVKIAKKMNQVSKDIKAEIKAEKEGTQLTLFCPGASIDTRVKWKLNERLLHKHKLKEKTAGRVYIDAMDALHIKELRIIDKGEYICTLDDVEIGLIRLKVISKYTFFDPSSNFGVFTLAMLGSFVIWLLIMALKWKNFAMQRKAFQLRNRRVQSEISLLNPFEEMDKLSSIDESNSLLS
ncbi:hypothetical protein JTE90_027666 [Oedothorax gibbosus]|uniref:Ig-like domain-containing protein n=1 Tax=Oedothorax gibbosus TaxID=931172 RepID=A0AAV6UQT7_9ARAC|nr:hypothetical protein JTE90_027666 [Oedothorax gibbosus]